MLSPFLPCPLVIDPPVEIGDVREAFWDERNIELIASKSSNEVYLLPASLVLTSASIYLLKASLFLSLCMREYGVGKDRCADELPKDETAVVLAL